MVPNRSLMSQFKPGILCRTLKEMLPSACPVFSWRSLPTVLLPHCPGGCSRGSLMSQFKLGILGRTLKEMLPSACPVFSWRSLPMVLLPHCPGGCSRSSPLCLQSSCPAHWDGALVSEVSGSYLWWISSRSGQCGSPGVTLCRIRVGTCRLRLLSLSLSLLPLFVCLLLLLTLSFPPAVKQWLFYSAYYMRMIETFIKCRGGTHEPGQTKSTCVGLTLTDNGTNQ